MFSDSSSPETHKSRLPTIASDLLLPYAVDFPLTSSPRLPPLSRVDPSLIQREAPLTLTSGLFAWGRKNWWDFGWFLGRKGFDLTWSITKYAIYGPPKKSWGIEMTVIAAIMRNIGQHSSLADITLVRQLISVHHLLPLPPDAIVTPISFVVKKRKEPLRGFFKDLDEKETGERELSGEWIVGKSVWKRLKMERKRRRMEREYTMPASQSNGSHTSGSATASAGGISHKTSPPRGNRSRGRSSSKSTANTGTTSAKTTSATSSSPTPPPRSFTDSSLLHSTRHHPRRPHSEKVIYYIHGGAYYVGQATTHRTITIALSKVCDARVFALNYRLAPEDRFPLGLLDVVNGYFRLIDSLHILPSNIIVVGDSAGAGLCLAMVMYLRDEGYTDRLPRALVLLSPWVDLTMSCGSWDENAPFDVVPQPGKDDHLNPVGCYLGPEGIKQYITHPYASPLFGDLSKLPPMLIQAGDAEVLRDEITLLAHKATTAGTRVQHELYTDQVHVFQSFPFLEATTAAFKSIGRFVSKLKDPVLPPVKPETTKAEESTRNSMDAVTSLPSAQVDRDARSVSRAGTPSSSISTSISSGVDTIGQEIQHGRTRLVKGDGTELDVLNMSDDDAAFDSDAAPSSDSRSEQRHRISTPTKSRNRILKSSPLAMPPDSDAEDEQEGQGGGGGIESEERGDASVLSRLNVQIQQPISTTMTSVPSNTPSVPTSPTKAPLLRRAFSSFGKIGSGGSTTAAESAAHVKIQTTLPHVAMTAERPNRRRPPVSFFTMSSISIESGDDTDREREHERERAAPDPKSVPLPTSPPLRGSSSLLKSSSRTTSRRPTISHQLVLSPSKPTTRNRSHSHSDMAYLVESYERSGAANRTTVYTPHGAEEEESGQDETGTGEELEGDDDEGNKARQEKVIEGKNGAGALGLDCGQPIFSPIKVNIDIEGHIRTRSG